MLFNSYSFLFAFLPATLIVFFYLGGRNTTAAAAWLAVASMIFYAWRDAALLGLLLPSIAVNFLAGYALARLRDRPRLKSGILLAAVGANLAALGYFKYANFFIATIDQAGFQFASPDISLPLGISFFTFTQIAFLVDASRGLAREYRLVHYALFVSYFPHLIAGPILHHKEMMPQFADKSVYRFSYENLLVGLSIFAIGLFKKTAIADAIAPHADSVFAAAREGTALTALDSWAGAIAYTIQLYFDFSGYSDMAIGLARLTGIRLPLNFASPYKASNIIDFWRRWHMTLSRFLRDYVYFALGGNRHGTGRRYTNLMVTMLLGGLWHGAGWTFIAWGALHGFYLLVNHGWRAMRRNRSDEGMIRAIGSRALTFIAVVVGWVVFRSDGLQTVFHMFSAMLGLQGAVATTHFINQRILVSELCLLAVLWIAPNTQELMASYRPAYNYPPGNEAGIERWLRWSPSAIWTIVIGVYIGYSFLTFAQSSDFLYFNF